jgi:ribosome-associated protein
LVIAMNPAFETLEGQVARMGAVIDELKGERIVALDLRGISDFADAFIIATTRSTTHMHSLSAQLVDKIRAEGMRPLNKPDPRAERWALIDYSNVIVHLFGEEARQYYDLESLWGDAQPMAIDLAQMA